jgi:hypothetical protein
MNGCAGGAGAARVENRIPKVSRRISGGEEIER